MHRCSSINRIAYLVRRTSVAALADDLDLDESDGSEETSFTNSNVALIKIRNVVVAVDFVDTFKTTFLNHG